MASLYSIGGTRQRADAGREIQLAVITHPMEDKFVLFSSNLVSARFVIGKVRTTSARRKCCIPNAKIVKSIALLVLARLLPRRLSFAALGTVHSGACWPSFRSSTSLHGGTLRSNHGRRTGNRVDSPKEARRKQSRRPRHR